MADIFGSLAGPAGIAASTGGSIIGSVLQANAEKALQKRAFQHQNDWGQQGREDVTQATNKAVNTLSPYIGASSGVTGTLTQGLNKPTGLKLAAAPDTSGMKQAKADKVNRAWMDTVRKDAARAGLSIPKGTNFSALAQLVADHNLRMDQAAQPAPFNAGATWTQDLAKPGGLLQNYSVEDYAADTRRPDFNVSDLVKAPDTGPAPTWQAPANVQTSPPGDPPVFQAPQLGAAPVRRDVQLGAAPVRRDVQLGAAPEMPKMPTLEELQLDPGWQFRLKQGTDAIQQSAAAKGMLNSTGTLKALARYSQDHASDEYGKAYNRTYGYRVDDYGRRLDERNAQYGANLDAANTNYTDALNERNAQYGANLDAANTNYTDALNERNLRYGADVDAATTGYNNALAAYNDKYNRNIYLQNRDSSTLTGLGAYYGGQQNDLYNRLLGFSGQGLNAANNAANIQANSGASLANLAAGIGSGGANNLLAQGNTAGNMFGNIANSLSNGISNSVFLDLIKGRNAGGSGSTGGALSGNNGGIGRAISDYFPKY